MPDHRGADVTRTATPLLASYDDVAAPRAAVVVLHGGQEHSRVVVSSRSLSWQRAAALARTLARHLRAERVAVRGLRYRRLGWNGDGAGPIADARWALERVRAELGEVPVVLVGHSMGGRTACRVADARLVQGVVALAPWLPEGEPVEALAGKELHAAHGRSDPITSASATHDYVKRVAEIAAAATFTDMGERGHYLLRGVRAWNNVTLDRVRRIID